MKKWDEIGAENRNFGQISGHLPGFCPLLKHHFDQQKPSVYAGLRAFWSISHFFLQTIMIKSLNIYINMPDKSGLLTKLIYGGILMSIKREVTWKDVFNHFKERYPNLSKGVVDYRPYDYMTIVVYFADGSMMTYNDSK